MTVLDAINTRDVATLERAVKRYETLGLEASLRITDPSQGRAALWHVDPRKRNAHTYQMEIEKSANGNFGRVVWTIQVARSSGLTMNMTHLSKVSSSTLLFALTKADKFIAEAKELERNGMPIIRQRSIGDPSGRAKGVV